MGTSLLFYAFQLSRPRNDERDMNPSFIVHLLKASKWGIVSTHGIGATIVRQISYDVLS